MYLLTLLFFSIPIKAQILNTDSLLRLINETNTDSLNGQIYYDLARSNYASDTKNALLWAQQGAKYFSNTSHHQLMTRCMNLEAVCLFILDKHEESVKLHYKILRIREQHLDTLGMGETLLNIGNNYYRGHDLEEAIKFYHKSREYALKSNNTKLLASLNNNLGNYYKDKYAESKQPNDKNLAIKHLKEAVFYKERLKTDRTLEKTYTILAHVYYESTDYKNSLYYAKRAEKYALTYKNDEAVGSSKILLCEIALINKDYDLAQSILDELYIYLSDNKAFHILNLFDGKIVVLRDKIRNLRANTSSSLDTLDDANYNSLLLSRQKVREELNIQYETEKKELENANLKLKNELAEGKTNKAIIITVVTSLFSIILLGLLLKLKKKNKAISESEQAIKKQALQLFNQNNLLKESEAFKTKLFSIISHDLKSPINSLKLIVQMSNDKQLTLENYAYLMSNVKIELDVTSNLLEDLLFWSKAQMRSNSVKWIAVNLNNTVEKCITTLSSSIKIKQLCIKNHIPLDFTILADQMRCEFIIRNILHNAIKYSELCRDIEIGILHKHEKWDIYVKDNGIGISQDHLEKLFDYEQSRRSLKGTMDEQGAGIGLLLCHDFIEELGWNFNIESEIGKGTTFHIMLPKNDKEFNSQVMTIKNNKEMQWN
ncbi:MAG: ATP-binding protein [Sphingobacterium composti]